MMDLFMTGKELPIAFMMERLSSKAHSVTDILSSIIDIYILAK